MSVITRQSILRRNLPDIFVNLMPDDGSGGDLGNPLANSVKYYAALEVLEQVKDRTWLANVTNTMNHHWQKKNAAKQTPPSYIQSEVYYAEYGYLTRTKS